jgi:16S rRNA (guanine527-N7)-methyltransferase
LSGDERTTMPGGDDSRETSPPGKTVSRETAPPVASDLFGDRLELARRYADHLATTGVEWGLIGPREVPILWTRHVLNCAVVGELIPEGSSVIDIGSGAGLPGLVLAIARPDLRLTLVEPLVRRTTWLDEVSSDLGLDVRVIRARAEEVVGVESAEVVTARAVAPLERLARWGLPLTQPGGELLAIKGRMAHEEVVAADPALRRLGAVDVDVVLCGTDVLDQATTVVRVRVGAGAGAGRPAPSRGSRGGGRRGTRRR